MGAEQRAEKSALSVSAASAQVVVICKCHVCRVTVCKWQSM